MSNKDNVYVKTISAADVLKCMLGLDIETANEKTRYRINLDKEIERVIFNDPATVVFWKDGTKTVSKCSEGDTFNKEHGLAMCIIRYVTANRRYNDVFEKYCK